jgi:hypothetical protein
MEGKVYTRNDIAAHLQLSCSRTADYITESKIVSEKKKRNFFIYTEKQALEIIQFVNDKRNVGKIELYKPYFITETFYIFESKMNNYE